MLDSVLLYFTRPSLLVTIAVVASDDFLLLLLLSYGDRFLKITEDEDYNFINPQADPFGTGYQVIPVEGGIGSGNITGVSSGLPDQTLLSSRTAHRFYFLGSW